jgi:cyclic beta-1,2-glucan synthetase
VISVSNPEHRCRGIASAQLDGAPVDPRAIALIQDGATHTVRLVLGDPTAPRPDCDERSAAS